MIHFKPDAKKYANCIERVKWPYKKLQTGRVTELVSKQRILLMLIKWLLQQTCCLTICNTALIPLLQKS